jgi:ketosteroid isomerase-like protein
VIDIEQTINELNEAAARDDIASFVAHLHPDAVWEHNIGKGSPEEGIYRGREEIGRLLERILEGWEYLRLTANEIRELEPEVYRIRGEMHCKHADWETEIVEPYEQQVEFRGELMVRGRMVLGGTLGK